MKVYLAAQYKQKEEILGYTKELESFGIEVVSDWVYETHSPDVSLKDLYDFTKEKLAERDLNEIMKADVFVLFSVDPEVPTKRGGRHTEFGFALGVGCSMVICGPKENIFHYLGGVKICPTWFATKEYLKQCLLEEKMTQAN